MRTSAQIVLLVVLVLSYSVSIFSQEALWKELYVKTATLYQQGRYSEAARVAEEALTVAEKTFGPNHLLVAKSLENLAGLYRAQGKYSEAEPLYKRTLKILEEALGPDHPYVAISLNNLALFYRAQGKYTDAEPLYKQSLAIAEKALGKKRPDVVTSLNNLAMASNRKVSATTDNVYEDLRVFTDVFTHLQKDYEETENRTLSYGAIKGMLNTLDPHSSFMSPEVYREMQAETKGKFEGLGLVIEKKKRLLTVVSFIEDTPALKAGVQSGDHIIKIDGHPTENMTLHEAAMKMRGAKGTKVTITITREGFAKPKDVTIVRDTIPLKSVKHEVLEKGIGYVRISQFNEQTASDFEKAIQKLHVLNKAPLKGLIVDLRNNPGGLLDQAVKVADRFISSGVIVSIEGRNKEQKMKFIAHRKGTNTNYPLIALVNGGSGAGSEILAGAFKDHARALILGTQTFGSSSLQTIFPLEDGSALRLTTAFWFTPKGNCVQPKGIEPDIIVRSKNGPLYPGEKDLERYLEGTKKIEIKHFGINLDTDNLMAIFRKKGIEKVDDLQLLVAKEILAHTTSTHVKEMIEFSKKYFEGGE